MMKRGNTTIKKMAVCSFAAVMTVMIGAGFGMTARAEMVIDSEEDIQAVMEMVPESEDMEVLEADAPAVEEETQEAGDMQIDISQVVVIEENLVPGAALPDFGFEAEAEAVQETEDAEVEDEQAAEIQEEKTETGVSGTLTYEDEEVVVTIVVSKEANLPADTEVKVSKLEEGSEQFETAKEAASQNLEEGEEATYTFYDVTLESEGQALAVEEGTVSVRMEFKTDAASKEVVRIEETESGKVARNVTDASAAAGRIGSTELAY